MRKIFILILLASIPLYSQTIQQLQTKADSLKNLENILQQKLKEVKEEQKNIHKLLLEKEFQGTNFIELKLKNDATVLVEPKYSKRIGKINSNSTIFAFGEINGYIRIKYKNRFGYINNVSVYKNEQYELFKEHQEEVIKQKVAEDRRNQKDQEEKQKLLDELERQKQITKYAQMGLKTSVLRLNSNLVSEMNSGSPKLGKYKKDTVVGLLAHYDNYWKVKIDSLEGYIRDYLLVENDAILAVLNEEKRKEDEQEQIQREMYLEEEKIKEEKQKIQHEAYLKE